MTLRILIVEDEVNSRFALQECLRMRGYAVEGAADGEEAIGLGRRFEPHVVICDWLLGTGPDGIEVSHRLVESNPELQVLLMSGMGADALAYARHRVPGVRAVLRKPLDIGELCTTVEAIAEDVGG